MEDTWVVEHIKDLCKQRGWSYYKLAQKANIPFSSLNTMLKHGHIPTTNNLIKICNGFGIKVSQFFAEIEGLTEPNTEEQELLSIWHLLDEQSKELALSYMYGLAKKERKIKDGL